MAKPARPCLGQDKQPELATAFAASHPQYRLVATGYWHNRERLWQRREGQVLRARLREDGCPSLL
ncbi:hypothetical protein [Streptomyces sp. NPDC059788]|uniref:hypothetical protein n=1 Tax=Streptomyces sp. NPDC059788 TaxID=3346948 RepID=UPI0036463291